MNLYEIEFMAYTSSTISSCTAQIGGGVSITRPLGAIVITIVEMLACSATAGGGGMQADSAGHIDLTSVAFFNCSAGDGQSHDMILQSGASVTCSATCTPGSIAGTGDPWACSDPYQAIAYDSQTNATVECMSYCRSAVTDCEVCSDDTYLSGSMITVDNRAQCGTLGEQGYYIGEL